MNSKKLGLGLLSLSLLGSLLGGVAVGGFWNWSQGDQPGSAEFDQVLSLNQGSSPAGLPASARASAGAPNPVADPKDNQLGASSMSAAAFYALTEDVKDQIPTVEQIQALPVEAIHHAPVALMRAGKMLGQVAQALHENPALAQAAKDFYQDCASEVSYPESVRALCLGDLRKLDVNAGASAQAQLPASVVQLAANLPY